MTLQEIFTKAETHLMTQMAKSKDDGGNCAYRGKDGKMCAVAPFIADEDYREDMEGQVCVGTVVRPAVCKTLGVTLLDRTAQDLLVRLQRIHDATAVEAWRDELDGLARRMDLKTSNLGR